MYKIKQTKHYALIGSLAAVLLLVVAAVFSGELLSPDEALAGTVTVALTDSPQEYYISVTSSDDISIDIETVADGAIAGTTDTVTVETNAPKGYSLYLSTAGTDNNLYLNGNTSGSKISPGGGETYSKVKALDVNTWGFALNKSNSTAHSDNTGTKSFENTYYFDSSYATITKSSKFEQVPGWNKPRHLAYYDGSKEVKDSFDIYYAVNASSALLSGTYTGTIAYTAVARAGSPLAASIYPSSYEKTSDDDSTLVTISTNYLMSSDDAPMAVSISGKYCTDPDTGSDVLKAQRQSNGYAYVVCRTPSDITYGTHIVNIRATARGSSTYSHHVINLENAFTYTGGYGPWLYQ